MESRFLLKFEVIVRTAHKYNETLDSVSDEIHPFEARNIHSAFNRKVKTFFNAAHYPEATFEAYKIVENKVKKTAGLEKSGFKLMMSAFNEKKPIIQLTALSTITEINEQKGFCHLFAGSTLAIRNPRGHETNIDEDEELCLDHLSFASFLLRRLARKK